jgi:hypothetical protein
LPNATFENGAQRWAYIGMWGGGTGTGRIDPPSFHNAAFTIPGPVRNAVGQIYSTASGSLYAAWQSEEFAVVPGETMVGFAELHPVGTNAAAGISFYTATGAYVGEMMGNTIVSVSSGNAYEWAYPATYALSRARGVVPAGAQVGRATIWANGNWWSQPQKYVSIYRPFAGRVPPTATLYPVWTPSGSNISGTPGIVPEAATSVYWAMGGVGVWPDQSNYGRTKIQGLAFTASVSGTVEVSLQFTYAFTAGFVGATGASLPTFYEGLVSIDPADQAGWSSWSSKGTTPTALHTGAQMIVSLPAGGLAQNTTSWPTLTFPVVAGQNVSISFWVRRTAVATTPSIVEKTVPSTGSVLCYCAPGDNLAFVNFRATHIKR